MIITTLENAYPGFIVQKRELNEYSKAVSVIVMLYTLIAEVFTLLYGYPTTE